MNLVDLVKRKDRALQNIPEGLVPQIQGNDGSRRLGLALPEGTDLQISGCTTFTALKSLPRDLGWWLAPDQKRPQRRGRLTFTVHVRDAAGRELQVARVPIPAEQARWWPVPFDWPVEMTWMTDPVLVLRVHGDGTNGKGAVFVGVSEFVDLRAPILALAKGTGIEIGPGPSPQVLPSAEVDVRYLERSPIEEWYANYQKGGAARIQDNVRALWDRYVVGDAQRMEEIQDASLDFLFGSHVFEHFVNPLGTLEVWRKKLKSRGRVLAVVPDAHHCFDLRQPLSRQQDWLLEWERGTFGCQDHHFEKWVRYTEPRVTVESLRQRSYSVHAHFYTPATSALLLQMAVELLGYSRFHIRGTANHKDFVWLLEL